MDYAGANDFESATPIFIPRGGGRATVALALARAPGQGDEFSSLGLPTDRRSGHSVWCQRRSFGAESSIAPCRSKSDSPVNSRFACS